VKSKVFHQDSRKIGQFLPSEIKIQTTITSPPYFDMKDYGVDNQVGYGQEYSDYLNDLKIIFKQVYDATKDDGTLWIVIDTFKRNNAIVPLPFDLAYQLKNVGWLLQDIIIWKKDKTVPWTSKGFVQRKFEYVLFFSKTPVFKYNKDRVRVYDTRQLKKWWVKYPERYNPRGKALDEIWEFPIPVQGSWGNEYIRHFCPLPKDMVANMISISSDENDIVLDPFAGSGTVLSQSAYMNRQYIGFELNDEYIKQFKTYLNKTLKKGKEEYKKLLNNNNQTSFETIIWDLRVLKYGRILINELEKRICCKTLKIFVEKIEDNTTTPYNVKYTICGIRRDDIIMGYINDIISKPPLSKFEIRPLFIFSTAKPKTRNCFFYSKTNSYSYIKDGNVDDEKVKVISHIKVDLNEKDYE
jgi:DNA modification methylase